MTVKPPEPIQPQKTPSPAKPKAPPAPAPDMLADMSAFDGDELDAPEGSFDADYIRGTR